MKHHLLIVEDEANQARLYADLLTLPGRRVSVAGTRRDALARLREERIDLVLTDYRLPDGTAADLIADLTDLRPGTPVVVVTAYGDMETAVACLTAGARDFLAKPVEPARLSAKVDALLETVSLRDEVRKLREAMGERFGATAMVGADERFLAECGRAAKAAATEATVLVTGESGTGKELVADLVHSRSARRDGPLVKVNGGAIPADLVESELFGHVRGAFTGAVADRAGHFDAARGGTLFLDEVGELPLPAQAKLLRAIQEREYSPVGSTAVRKADVRFVFATNRDLEAEVAAGRFREDLYYRVSVVTIRLPALRERRGDIPDLARFFLKGFAATLGRAAADFSSDALDALAKYPWPGNVRELRNAVETALVLLDPEAELVRLADLPERLRRPAAGAGSPADPMERAAAAFVEALRARRAAGEAAPLAELLGRLERDAFADALRESGGAKAPLAKFFRMDEKNVRYKLKKFGLG